MGKFRRPGDNGWRWSQQYNRDSEERSYVWSLLRHHWNTIVINILLIFSISYFQFSDACSITDDDTDSVILTGGDPTHERVERYGHTGLLETLPSLNEGRQAHGCGSYYTKYGKKVVIQTSILNIFDNNLQIYLVAGGYYYGKHLSSTETWSPLELNWRTVFPLPRPVAWTEAVSLNNMIYLIGH